MKQFLLVLLSIFIIALTLSCSSVTIRYPISKSPDPINQEKFEGIWLVDDDDVIHVKFDSNGIARIAGLEWENNQFTIMHGEMIISSGDEHNFLFVRFQEDDKWMDDYYFLIYKFTEKGDLILWLPNVDAFEEAISKKYLQGIIETGQYSKDITITNTSEKLLEFINGSDNLILFEYREPIVLYKITK
jgi:hypothetical protein